MQEKIQKLRLAAKRMVPILTVVLLLGQISVTYVHLIEDVKAMQQAS